MQWILDQLPEKAKTISILFSSSKNGWKVADWRTACMGKA